MAGAEWQKKKRVVEGERGNGPEGVVSHCQSSEVSEGLWAEETWGATVLSKYSYGQCHALLAQH